jgi:hypothetical protein
VSASKDQITAIDNAGNTMYTVKYDKANKTPPVIECVGEGQGSTTNEYTGIKYYDIDKKASSTMAKTCHGQTFVATSGTAAAQNTIYYTGDEDLVQYMKIDNMHYFLNN